MSHACSFKEFISALEMRNASDAEAIYVKDNVIDRLYTDLFNVVTADLPHPPEPAQGDVQALFVGKALEHAGDRLTDIAEEVRFMPKGDAPRATRETIPMSDEA